MHHSHYIKILEDSMSILCYKILCDYHKTNSSRATLDKTMSELQRLLNAAMTEGTHKQKKKRGGSSLSMIGPQSNSSTIRNIVRQALREELKAEQEGNFTAAGLGGSMKKRKKKSSGWDVLEQSLSSSKKGKGLGGALGGGPVGGSHAWNKLTPDQRARVLILINNPDFDAGDYSVRRPMHKFKKPYKGEYEEQFYISDRTPEQFLPRHAAQRALKAFFLKHHTKQPFIGDQRKKVLSALSEMYDENAEFATNVAHMIDQLADVY